MHLDCVARLLCRPLLGVHITNQTGQQTHLVQWPLVRYGDGGRVMVFVVASSLRVFVVRPPRFGGCVLASSAFIGRG